MTEALNKAVGYESDTEHASSDQPVQGGVPPGTKWRRMRLLALQLLMSGVIVLQLIAAHEPLKRALFWGAAILVVSVAVLIPVRVLKSRIVLCLSTLDSVIFLGSCTLGPLPGVIAAYGMIILLLVIAHSATLTQGLFLSVIVEAFLGYNLLQLGLLQPEHAVVLPLGMLLLMSIPREARSSVDVPASERAKKAAAPPQRDALTGLLSRQDFVERVWRAMRWKRTQPDAEFAVLFVDLDNFKPINDRHGHKAGDLVLQRVAQRLKARLKAGDIAARYGGDEFVLLINGVRGQEDVIKVVDRLISAIQEPIDVGTPVQVGASIGIALSTSVHARPEDLIKDADAAMYRAKANGKNGYAFSDQNHDTSATDMKSRLRHLLHAWAK